MSTQVPRSIGISIERNEYRINTTIEGRILHFRRNAQLSPFFHFELPAKVSIAMSRG
jgi:hypothetical protein